MKNEEWITYLYKIKNHGWDEKISQIAINDIANGIYHYEIEFASMKKTIGKLTILK